MATVPTEPHVILVTPRDSYRIGAHLDAARALGCRATVVTDAQLTVPASSTVVVDLVDPARTVTAVIEHLGDPPDAVVGTDGPALLFAAALAERLDLITSPSDAVRIAGDKAAQRAALDRAGLRQPRWALVGPDGSWPDVGGGPVVVKPTDRQGGQGVVRADTPEAGRAAVARVRRLVGRDAPVLVERYVDGSEVTADLLMVAGEARLLAVFDKPDAGSGPFFAETLLVGPTRLPDGDRDRVVELVKGAARAVGLTDGPVHVEARIDGSGRPWFIELASRSIGGRCSGLIRPLDRPLEEVLLGAALGRQLPLALEVSGTAGGVYMIPVPAPGIFEGVRGVGAAEALPGISGVDLTAAPGTEVHPLPEGNRYLGFVFADGSGPDEVERVLRQAAATLEVSVSPSGSTGRSRRRGR